MRLLLSSIWPLLTLRAVPPGREPGKLPDMRPLPNWAFTHDSARYVSTPGSYQVVLGHAESTSHVCEEYKAYSRAQAKNGPVYILSLPIGKYVHKRFANESARVTTFGACAPCRCAVTLLILRIARQDGRIGKGNASLIPRPGHTQHDGVPHQRRRRRRLPDDRSHGRAWPYASDDRR